MPSRRAYRVALAAGAVAVLLLSVSGVAFRREIVTTWHLRKLEKGDPAGRRNAVEKLGAMRSTRAVPAFLKALEGADEDLEGAIVDASREIGAEAAPVVFDVLRRAREDASLGSVVGEGRYEVSRRAADALTEMGPASVVAAATKDPMSRQAYADALVKKQRYEEALEQYVWCYEHGNESSIGYGGVRNSFLLGDITELARLYPPALQFLRDRRDVLEAKLLVEAAKVNWLTKLMGGRNPALEVIDIAALNEELEEPDRTLSLFEKLKDADCRRILLESVIDHLLEQKRYTEIVEAAGDVFTRLGMQGILPAVLADQRAQSYLRGQWLEDAGKYYQAFLGAGRLEQASAIADGVIRFEPGAEGYATLVRRASLAGAEAQVRDLLERAAKALPAADLEQVRKARDDP